MATVNTTSVLNTIQPHYNPYAPRITSSAQPTPVSSVSATPTNTSPTSPRPSSTSPNNTHNLFTRQLRPPKTPLYVPAVLRPTQRPARYSSSISKPSSQESVSKTGSVTTPLTPPSTPGTSFDSKDGGHMEENAHRRIMCAGLVQAGISGVSRVVTDEWNDEAFEDVTGAPTRDHWKPDTCAPFCDLPVCQVSFTLLNRRHHCRRCGNIFCSSHSPHTVPLDQHARFHPQGTSARACDCCWADYNAWKRARSERGSSSSQGSGSVTPVAENEERGVPVKGIKGKVDMLVGSVPRDWNWSTF